MEIWFQDEARLGQKNGLTRLSPAGRSAITTPICSAPSVRLTARGRRSCCLGRTRKPCRCISTRSAATSPERPCGCADGSGRMAHHRQTQSFILLPSRAPEVILDWLSNRSDAKHSRTARNHQSAKMGPYRFKIERMSENAVVATIVYLAAQNLAFFGATLFATVYAARRIGIAAALSH